MSEPAERIRILLIDDHALFRESIARLLGRERGFDLVAHSGSIEEALVVLRQSPVDLVLLDFDLGQRDGIDFMRLAKEQGVNAKILIVTAGMEPGQAAELIRSGISGIFMKRHSAALLAHSIRDVMAGRLSFDQELFQKAMAGGTRAPDEALIGHFTSRERQVLSYVFEGLANKE